MENNTPICPICKDKSRQVSLQVKYSYYQCINCETSFLYPCPSSEYLQEFYNTYHAFSGSYSFFEHRTSADFPAKAEIVRKWLQKSNNCNESTNVLDVGCGKGFFVKELLNLGFQAEGIDVSVSAIDIGRYSLGLKSLRAGLIEDQKDWHGRFDAVVSWATIEHLSDPQGYFRSIRQVLKPDGLLFLDTGLAADFVEKWTPGLTQWYESPEHLFVFSRKGLEKLLNQSGFVLLNVDENFERSLNRRLIKYIRNRSLAFCTGLIFRTLLGKQTFSRMRMESKMPFGSLIFLIARVE
jgi:SAM-dependent methyltransferase